MFLRTTFSRYSGQGPEDIDSGEGEGRRINEFHSSSGKFDADTIETLRGQAARGAHARAVLSRFDTSSRYCDEITGRSWPLLNEIHRRGIPTEKPNSSPLSP